MKFSTANLVAASALLNIAIVAMQLRIIRLTRAPGRVFGAFEAAGWGLLLLSAILLALVVATR